MQQSPDDHGYPGRSDSLPARARAVDAGFESRDPEVGTAVVELVLSGADFEVAASRVERALRAEQETIRRYGQVAAGDLARLHGRLTPPLYRLLRTAGLGSSADSAIKDVLTFVPFRALPGWFRYQSLRLSVRNYAEGRWLRLVDAAETLRDRLTRRDQDGMSFGRQTRPLRPRGAGTGDTRPGGKGTRPTK